MSVSTLQELFFLDACSVRELDPFMGVARPRARFQGNAGAAIEGASRREEIQIMVELGLSLNVLSF